ncbi:MAG: FAD-dependent oxidoreductase [Dehalococcoidia bacterium]|nr:FAD-dependent oxidoreductase [Dehalococcoidia bacterium]
MTRYVIVGNSAGGIGAAETIRATDPDGHVTILSDESYPAYSRPAISEFLAGERTFGERMLFRDADFYKRLRIECMLGTRVARVHTKERAVELSDGRRVPYDRLLLATGGTPIIPRMEGLTLRGVHPFTTMDHAKSFHEALSSGKNRVVVIGAGLIGCSLVNGLLHRGGIQITLVELKDRVLSTMVDTHASSLVEKRLSKMGVSVRTGRSATRILPRPDDATSVGGVMLDNGELVSCDVVGMAVGVTPRAELAREADIRCNRGILVDAHMETSARGVFACGDVAEAQDFIYGVPRVTAIWPTAYMGGRVAGANMAGATTRYDGCTAMNAFSYFDMALISAGMFDPDPALGYPVVAREKPDAYKKLVIRDHKLIGFVMAGEIEQSGVLFNLLREQTDVRSFEGRLADWDFSMASLPRDLRGAWIGGPGYAAPTEKQPVAGPVAEKVSP